MPKRTAVKHTSLKHAQPHAKPDPQSQPKPKAHFRLGGLATWVWLAVVVLVLFEAMTNNNQATSGQKLATLQRQQVQLSEEVSNLERQVSATGSLQSIRQRATEQLGLQEVTKNVAYVAWPTPTPSSDSAPGSQQ